MCDETTTCTGTGTSAGLTPALPCTKTLEEHPAREASVLPEQSSSKSSRGRCKKCIYIKLWTKKSCVACNRRRWHAEWEQEWCSSQPSPFGAGCTWPSSEQCRAPSPTQNKSREWCLRASTAPTGMMDSLDSFHRFRFHPRNAHRFWAGSKKAHRFSNRS